jgi:hypothetical protein
MANKIPPHLNSRPVITPEAQFVCPRRETTTNVFGKIKANYVKAEYQKKGANIQKSDRVALKEGRRRLVGDKIIEKSEGKTRYVLLVRDYNIGDPFDFSAYRVVRGRRAPCGVLPAIRTGQFLTIAEGVFSLDEVDIKK